MGVQGKDFKADLLGPNSKPSKGLRKANLSPRTKALLEEIALSEQVLSWHLRLHSAICKPACHMCVFVSCQVSKPTSHATRVRRLSRTGN